MNKFWRYFIPGYIWGLPTTLLGLIVGVLFYRITQLRFRDGCLEAVAGTRNGRTRIWNRPTAQTIGWLIVYAQARDIAPGRLSVHERVHVVQSHLLGPFMLPMYGIAHLIVWALQGFKDHHDAYLGNPFEIQAYKRQSRTDAWGAAEKKQ